MYMYACCKNSMSEIGVSVTKVQLFNETLVGFNHFF